MAYTKPSELEMAEIEVTKIESDETHENERKEKLDSKEYGEIVYQAEEKQESKRERSWTRLGLRDRGKSAKTLSDEWWEGKKPFEINGKKVPVFFMKWFLFLKYEEPPKHISILQQTAWGWRPRLNFWCVLPILIATAAFFIIFGVPMIVFQMLFVFRFVTEYTHCPAVNSSADLRNSLQQMLALSSVIRPCEATVNLTTVNFTTCEQYVSAIPLCVLARVRINHICYCSVALNVEQDLEPPSFLFYELNNFFISHRRFAQSWFGRHFVGADPTGSTLSCGTYTRSPNGSVYFPCGMVTNAFFNDTITPLNFNFTKNGLNFWRYLGDKFANPSPLAQEAIINETASPPAWPYPVYQLPGGVENPDFVAWHATSAFPNFRKLYGVINGRVSAGVYNFTISYNYPVTSVSAKKFISVGTTAWMGGEPSGFLSYSYIVLGVLIALTTIFIIIVHFPLKLRNTKSFLQKSH